MENKKIVRGRGGQRKTIKLTIKKYYFKANDLPLHLIHDKSL
jgi:hypothetical protein